jgi:uncharacterized membrane protein YqhA
MSPFMWRSLIVLSVLFTLFTITAIALNLVLVSQVKSNGVNDIVLQYVEVANWILVGILAITVITSIIVVPYISSYTHNSQSIVSTGLRMAIASNKEKN